MELPQPRPFSSEGRKATHDFLSLYFPVQQDPRPPQGRYLETHDFLQPLEQARKNVPKEEDKEEVASTEKPPPPGSPPSVEHILPGGIGTYSISHIPYIHQSVPKPEGAVFTVAQASGTDINKENSNCNSSPGSCFMLWEESALKKGKTGKENIAGDRRIMEDVGVKIVGQSASPKWLSASYSSNYHRSNTLSSLSSSQQSLAQKNQSFMDMIASAKSSQEEDEDDDEFMIKKELSPNPRSNLTVKVDGKRAEQKANTPRSKHSATEQRRRCKINDRFQMLRGLIPNSDQKRDKASFLLEVIEYIRFLQEKLLKYEESYQGWNHEAPKLMPWGTNNGSGPALTFPVKNYGTNIANSPNIPRSGQNQVGSDISTATTFKAIDQDVGLTNIVAPFPVPLNSNLFHPVGSSIAQLPTRAASATANMTSDSQPSSQLWQSKSCITDCTHAIGKLKEQEATIESGNINISSHYSQGLLNTLTQALRSSGVDLSQASISLKINLGKQANNRLLSSSSMVKHDAPSNNKGMACSRVANTCESDQASKRLKTGSS